MSPHEVFKKERETLRAFKSLQTNARPNTSVTDDKQKQGATTRERAAFRRPTRASERRTVALIPPHGRWGCANPIDVIGFATDPAGWLAARARAHPRRRRLVCARRCAYEKFFRVASTGSYNERAGARASVSPVFSYAQCCIRVKTRSRSVG